MMHVGDILSTVGNVQYLIGYHDKCGDILSTMGCSVPWGIHECHGGYPEYCGVILSTVGDTQYRGDIMMHVGEYHDYRGDVQYRGILKYQNIFSHGIEHPHDIPHVDHDILHSTEYPPWYSRYPLTVLIISSHGTEHPDSTQGIPPHAL